MAALSTEVLREKGLAALERELGKTEALRFLQLFSGGGGDYTRDRWNWLDPDADVATLVEMIRARRSDRANTSA